jgi:CheY-like chemotaxis protein
MHRLLLIDDDEHLAPPLAACLRRFDFELQSALRPSDGLALLAGGGFDAVILDVMLPEMDGFEVCRRIRQASAPFHDIPVLMLTARGELRDRVVGLEGEPFYRPDVARTRSAGGVGLGLHLCRLVALSHGGTLQLGNAAPGLEVSLWLPASAATAPSASA